MNSVYTQEIFHISSVLCCQSDNHRFTVRVKLVLGLSPYFEFHLTSDISVRWFLLTLQGMGNLPY